MKYKEVSEIDTDRIWTKNQFRVFLSHKSTHKKEVATLKKELENYGICAFVAHNDIEPSKEWQDEIEKALLSMDAFVALITEDFYDGEGDWTNQEIGFSIAFDIPHIYVDLGNNPRGFAAKIQALKCFWANASREIFNVLSTFSEVQNYLIENLKNTQCYIDANKLYNIIETFDLNQEQCDKIIYAYNNNTQISGSYYFRTGIISYLNKKSDKQYKLNEINKIVEVNMEKS